MKASTHPRQAERLATLKSYNILDTERESDFDDIAALAAKICQTPISVVNLIDAERQWFKAEVGLGTRETPLETSICSHIILEQDFTLIEDTHTDPRTADNELCTPDDGLRFYAGALLKAENGLPIGTLCVLDNKPNTLNTDQQHALKVLARHVMRELDLRRALAAQDVLRDEMDHRIKNSLAITASAVRLYKTEARKTGNVDAAFDALQRQLEAVSAVHQAVYLSENSGEVDLKGYLETLTGHLGSSMPRHVHVSATSPSLSVSPKIASTVGLIANEFATNTIKHGKTSTVESADDIFVHFEASINAHELTIVCHNNVPEHISGSDDTPQGIGARLMQASVAQFGGHLTQKARTDGFELVATLPST